MQQITYEQLHNFCEKPDTLQPKLAMSQKQKKRILGECGCTLSIYDKENGVYSSYCIYDGRVIYGTIDQLFERYGLS